MIREDSVDLSGLAFTTPNFSYTPLTPGQTIPVMGGVRSVDDGAGLDNSIAIFWMGSTSVEARATISRCSTWSE